MHTHTHLGVYALIINIKKQQIVLIKKARGPYTGLLDLPGGSLEFGETVEQALVREVKEETNLDVQQSQLLEVATCTYKYKTKEGENAALHHIGILYRVSVQAGELREIGDQQDSDGAEFFTIATLDTAQLTPFVKHVLRAYCDK